jgi:hypothetical protein
VIAPICHACGQELTEFGGILLSPPQLVPAEMARQLEEARGLLESAETSVGQYLADKIHAFLAAVKPKWSAADVLVVKTHLCVRCYELVRQTFVAEAAKEPTT